MTTLKRKAAASGHSTSPTKKARKPTSTSSSTSQTLGSKSTPHDEEADEESESDAADGSSSSSDESSTSAGSNDAEEGEIPPSPVVTLSVPGDPSWTHPIPPVVIPKPPRENESLQVLEDRHADIIREQHYRVGGTRRMWIE